MVLIDMQKTSLMIIDVWFASTRKRRNARVAY